ncbi:hypothetical protein NA57DRAFT_74701 [Rhizodiscina lignyota]|uniref:Uncharacterized protein n=1 Tax=Rhizodiscina lignyota TaxID=1504668 RepID=A0A9P4M821_9PEZI|nr:hypothetical protein NA57DRAFT_74701 [Rhizodiscina lignyota]
MAPPKLEYLFKMKGYLAPDQTVEVGTVKSGPQRIFAPIVSGWLEGPSVGRAEATPGGGDWMLVDPQSQTIHLDVRFCAKWEDGNAAFFHYPGIIQINEKVMKAMTYAPDAKSTEFEDLEFWTSPIVEISNKELKWLERSMLVAQGKLIHDDGGYGVEYEVYKLAH